MNRSGANARQIYKRSDGKYAFRVTASNGQTVARDGSQGYSSKSDANSMRGDYNGAITEDD